MAATKRPILDLITHYVRPGAPEQDIKLHEALKRVNDALFVENQSPDPIPNAVYGEVPTGVIDSANKVFFLKRAPSPSTSLRLYRNGLRMIAGGVDFTLSVRTITYVAAMMAGTSPDVHVADYD